MKVTEYSSTDAAIWDGLCEVAPNATFLHSRRFLSHQGERFSDASILLWAENHLVAAFPAAKDPADPSTVISHPGLTYGGLIHNGSLTGERQIEALRAVGQHYKSRGYERLIYKAVPHIYHRAPSQDDLYALFRVGAIRHRCDLSCCVDLEARPTPSQRRKRGEKKALNAVVVDPRSSALAEYWSVLNDNLQRKHGAKPVHSSEELQKLSALFPQALRLIAALSNGTVCAGALFFCTPRVWHAQYIAASEIGYEHSALDAVFGQAMDLAAKDSIRYFDFGTTNGDQGRVLNEGLYRYKAEHGGSGVAYEQYTWNL